MSPNETRFGALARDALEELLSSDPPLVEALRDVSSQLQPNGIDLTISEIFTYASEGALARDSAKHKLPSYAPEPPQADDWYQLDPGSYLVQLQERLQIPNDLVGIAQPRSTLLRCGATVATGVFDAGYQGRPQVLLTVWSRHGLRVQSASAICQLVLFTLTHASSGYTGKYQEQRG